MLLDLKAQSELQMKSLFYRKRTTPAVIEPIRPMPSLAACILMDLLGYATYAIPFVGELLDILWAPISAIIFMKMFGFRKGFFGGVFNFFEELLPGFDLIPTFTITWFMQYSKRSKNVINIQAVTRS